jgi:serine protease Do
MTLLEDLETTVQDVVKRVGPAVVGLGRGWGVGSGVVIGPGRVLTNAHNLRHGHDESTVTFADGRRASGRVAAADADLDIAVIHVDTGEVDPIEWATNGPGEGEGSAEGEGPGEGDDDPKIGRAVLALANPGGRGLRVTPGFVSSTERSFRGPRGRRFRGAIEHTAPLPRGSSGGPLVDTSGRLLGINSVRVDGGLILAIPASGELRERVEALGRGEAPKRVRLGVAIAPPRVARKLRRAVGLPERDGALVRGVEDGSPADRAGIERGDLIVAAGGRDIDRIEVLYDALEAARADGSIELAILRGTDERTVKVTF